MRVKIEDNLTFSELAGGPEDPLRMGIEQTKEISMDKKKEIFLMKKL